jgi:hypothetical protein
MMKKDFYLEHASTRLYTTIMSWSCYYYYL